MLRSLVLLLGVGGERVPPQSPLTLDVVSDVVASLFSPLHLVQTLSPLLVLDSEGARRAVRAGGLAGYLVSNSPWRQIQMATFPEPPKMRWHTEAEVRNYVLEELDKFAATSHGKDFLARSLKQRSGLRASTYQLPQSPFKLNIFDFQSLPRTTVVEQPENSPGHVPFPDGNDP
eukprot:Gregarina_sp_Poly_1__2047@NODE_1538_length_3900_cov_91_335247_g1015_i0_p2_GENE_NODE_1538_length_3900_cov_91_335247_g1015_i0NODE_1538_length_3900_cov_91_335247_g1015_i0_p2_ORF_typecomplete_len174_score22_78DUF3636/PF12331_8/0_15_NODE_1538_length_3900_cov_91_335247_g1015_i017442265